MAIGRRGRKATIAPSRDGVKSLSPATSAATPTKFKSKIGSARTTGPAWKPAKSSVSGNYGKAVSAAAKAKSSGSPAPGAPNATRFKARAIGPALAGGKANTTKARPVRKPKTLD